MPLQSIGSPVLWAGFVVFVLAMLVIDLGVFHRKAHQITLKEAGIWSAVWVALAAVFNAGVYLRFGPDRALEFTTGYLLEKALAVDNIFVFVIIFSAFAVPAVYQHRVLFWGVLGALVMRAAFIFAGAALLAQFHWVIYVFGAFLIVTGLKMALFRNAEMDPGRNPVLRLVRRVLPITPAYEGDRFFVRHGGKLLATPLFLVLVMVETTDLIFAVDSIPAIFAVTTDPFLVYTSNVFAILGLRSLYFVLAGVMETLSYLKVGLAAVLVFVGIKMTIVDVYKIPPLVSLAVIATLLGAAVAASLWKSRHARQAQVEAASGPASPPETLS